MDVFDVLADPVRCDILVRLSRRSTRVVDLAGTQTISRPAISRHLKVLTRAGLAVVEDHGRERHYRLADPAGLAPVQAFLDALVQRPPIPEQTLDALGLEVRRAVREHRTKTPHPQEESA